MASIIVERGLQIIGGRASATADGFAELQSMAVDDDSNAFTSTDTALDDAGGAAPTNVATADFDATPTRTAQTVEHVATFAAGEANFNVRRISMHNDLAANVTGTSDTLFGGIDGQSITKTSDFSMTITINVTYSDNS